MTAPYVPQAYRPRVLGGVGELDNFLSMRSKAYDNALKLLGSGIGLDFGLGGSGFSDVQGGGSSPALAAKIPTGSQSVVSGLASFITGVGDPERMDDTELVGTAEAWGIPDAGRIPRPALIEIIKARRADGQDAIPAANTADESWLSRYLTSQKNEERQALAGWAMAGTEAASSFLETASGLAGPFSPAVRSALHIEDARRWLEQLQERSRMSLSGNEAESLDYAAAMGTVTGQLAPISALYKGMQVATGLAFGRWFAPTSLIARGVLPGAGTSLWLESSIDKPWLPDSGDLRKLYENPDDADVMARVLFGNRIGSAGVGAALGGAMEAITARLRASPATSTRGGPGGGQETGSPGGPKTSPSDGIPYAEYEILSGRLTGDVQSPASPTQGPRALLAAPREAAVEPITPGASVVGVTPETPAQVAPAANLAVGRMPGPPTSFLTPNDPIAVSSIQASPQIGLAAGERIQAAKRSDAELAEIMHHTTVVNSKIGSLAATPLSASVDDPILQNRAAFYDYIKHSGNRDFLLQELETGNLDPVQAARTAEQLGYRTQELQTLLEQNPWIPEVQASDKRLAELTNPEDVSYTTAATELAQRKPTPAASLAQSIGTQVLDPSGSPMLMFSGTTGNFAEFDVGLSKDGLVGPGAYFTSDARIAGGSSGPGELQNLGSDGRYKDTQTGQEPYASVRMLGNQSRVELLQDTIRVLQESGVADALKVDRLRELQAELEAESSRSPNVRPAYIAAKKIFHYDLGISAKEARELAMAVATEPGLERYGRAATTLHNSISSDGISGNSLYNQLAELAPETNLEDFSGLDPELASLGKRRLNQVLRNVGYQAIDYNGGQRVGTSQHYAINVLDPMSVVPRFADAPMLSARAEYLGTQLSKQQQVMASPALAEIAGHPMVSDLDVMVSAVGNLPGGTSVIRGIGDPASIARENAAGNLAALGVKGWQFVQRGQRLDLIINTLGDVPADWVKMYEDTGLFPGMTALKTQGTGTRGVTVLGKYERGKSGDWNIWVTKPAAQTIQYKSGAIGKGGYKIKLSSLIPTYEGPGWLEAGGLFEKFYDFATGKLVEAAATAGVKDPAATDPLSDVGRKYLPVIFDEFMDSLGIVDPAQVTGLRAFFDARMVEEYRNLAPEETVLDRSISTQLETGKVLKFELPSSPQGDAAVHIIKQMAESFEDGEMEIPRRDEDILEEELLFKLASSRGMRASPGEGPGTWIVEDETSPVKHQFSDIFAAQDFLRAFQRQPQLVEFSEVPLEVSESMTPDNDVIGHIEPAREVAPADIEEIEAIEEAAETNTSRFVATLRHDATSAVRMAGGGGGGGGTPPLGTGFPESFGELPPGGNRTSAQLGRTLKPHIGELNRRFHRALYQWLWPVRYMFQDLESALMQIGGGAEQIRPWQDTFEISRLSDVAHNEAHPSFVKASTIFDRMPSKPLREGKIWDLWVKNSIDRAYLARTPAYSLGKDVSVALNELDKLFEDIHSGEGHTTQLAQLKQFVKDVRSRQLRGTDDSPYGSVGDYPSIEFFRSYAEEAMLDLRLPNAAKILNGYIKSYTFNKHVGPKWESTQRQWNSLNNWRDSNGSYPLQPLAQFMLDWMNFYRHGYEPGKDLVLDATQSIVSQIVPITKKEASDLVNGFLGNIYRAVMGWRIYPIIRDQVQPWISAPTVGLNNLRKAYVDILRDKKLRTEIITRMADYGVLQRGIPPIDTGGMIEGELLPGDAAQAFTPAEVGRRKIAAAVADFLRDMTPVRFRTLNHTMVDPMWAYTNQGGMSRVIVGRAAELNFDNARDAFFKAANTPNPLTYNDVMSMINGDSFAPPVRRLIGDALASGNMEKAKITYVNEVVNETQHRFGSREMAPGWRSHTARIGVQFGSYSVQTLRFLKNKARFGSLSYKVRAMLMFGGLLGALKIASDKTGMNFMKYNPFSLPGSRLGPAAEALTGAAGAVSDFLGLPGLLTGERQPSQDEFNSYGDPYGTASKLMSSFNPVQGALEGFSQIDASMDSPNPTLGLMNYLLTGDRQSSGFPYKQFFNQNGEELLRQPIPSTVQGAGGAQ